MDLIQFLMFLLTRIPNVPIPYRFKMVQEALVHAINKANTAEHQTIIADTSLLLPLAKQCPT